MAGGHGIYGIRSRRKRKMAIRERIRQWWNDYKARLPYTRKELEKIHKDVFDKREPSGEMFLPVAMVTLEATVWDKVVGDYRELRASSLVALGFILLLELFIIALVSGVI